MPTTRLSRSIPFWVLVAGSVVAIEVEAVEVISAPAWEDEVVETVPASRAEARTAAAPVTAAAPATAAADPEVAFAAEEPDATSPTDAETPRA